MPLKGICHYCFTTDVELVIDRGQILCQDCFGKRHPKKSAENEEISFDKLKEKLERS